MKRHNTDLTSLVSGAIFVAVAVIYLLDLTTDSSASPRWVVPLVLIGIGLAGLLSSVRTGDRKATKTMDAAAVDDDVLTTEPMATEPLTTEPLTTDPMATDPTLPLATEPDLQPESSTAD